MRNFRHFLPVLLLLPCPLSAAPGDADNDGLRDAVETHTGVFVSADNTGTNPNLADSDGDSMPDGMELGLGTNPVNAASKVTRPNIILINCDDLGVGDVGCFWQNQRTGTQKFATPNLDAMAAQGAMLTHHYVGAPICASSRSSLLQGRHQGHADIRNSQFDQPLPDNHSIASMLKASGYRTVHLGKAGLVWYTAHPLLRGFDRFLGYLYHSHAHEHYPRNGVNANQAVIMDDYRQITDAHQDLFSADLYTAFAKKTIIDETTQNPQRPFFIYLAYDTPHFTGQTPPTANYPTNPTEDNPRGLGRNGGIQWTGAPSYVNTAINDPNRINNPLNQHPSVNPTWPVKNQTYVSMIRRIDDSVADILQTIRDCGIENRTLVVFTTDNGPESFEISPQFFQSYGGFEGIKGDLWEGGIRTPTIVWAPGLIPGSNNTANIRRIATPSAQYDWLATFAELAKVPVPGYTDGSSLLPDLTGLGTRDPNSWYYYTEMYKGGITGGSTEFINHGGDPRDQMQAIRIGDFMGVRLQMTAAADTPFRIYNVVTDPKQAVNVAASRPDLQKRMQYLGLAARRPDDLESRPYDTTPLPALPPAPVRNGVKWKAYEGYWPWLPEFRTLTPVSSGTSLMPTPAVRSRDKDAGLVFEGYLQVPAAGAYTFQLAANSNTALWIHDCHVIDNNYNYTPTKAGAPIYLSAGRHPFRLYYRHQTGTPSLALSWSGPGITLQPVPASSFFVDGQPTVLQADTASTTKESPVTVDVLANDTAENPLQLLSMSPPRRGYGSISNGKVLYTPSAGFIGTDQFSYTVNDGVQELSSTVQAEVLFDDEIWIPLDEGTGTSVTAYGTGVPAQGSLAGAIDPSAAWVSGRLGKALIFDGAEMQAAFPNLPLPTGNAPRSFSCWIKTDHASLAESQTLFTYGQGTGQQRFTIRLDRGPSSPDSLVAAVESLPGRIVGSKSLNDGAWHHLVVVHGGTDIPEVKLYVDGQPDLPSVVSPGIPATAGGSGAVLGGRDDSASGNFKGTLDDVRIFSKALTPTEAGGIYQTSLANVILDSDGDGFTDLEEEVAGTNPNDPTSFLRLETVIAADGKVTLRWAGVAGRTYLIEESTDLGEWLPVEGLAPLVIHAAMPNASITLPSNGDPQRFFRIKVSMTPVPGPDTDRDGFPDGAEIMAGTNPDDPSSFFRIDSMTMSESGLSLKWAGKPGRRYRVEESDNLFQWTRVPNLPAFVATEPVPEASILVPANGAPKRFLRMQVEPVP